jgi:hypothetical protein
MIYDHRELLGVSTAGPGIGRGVTNGIRADPHGFTSACGLGVRVYGAWRMWAQSVARLALYRLYLVVVDDISC